jgi:hypothetical protein
MIFHQVLEIKGIPNWATVNNTMIHPPTVPGKVDHSDLTIAQYLKRFQADGTIGQYETAIFSDVLEGQTSASIVMMISNEYVTTVQSKTPEIKRILQETLGKAATISLRECGQR